MRPSEVPILTVANPSLRGWHLTMPETGAFQSTVRDPVYAHFKTERGNTSHVPFSSPASVCQPQSVVCIDPVGILNGS